MQGPEAGNKLRPKEAAKDLYFFGQTIDGLLAETNAPIIYAENGRSAVWFIEEFQKGVEKYEVLVGRSLTPERGDEYNVVFIRREGDLIKNTEFCWQKDSPTIHEYVYYQIPEDELFSWTPERTHKHREQSFTVDDLVLIDKTLNAIWQKHEGSGEQ